MRCLPAYCVLILYVPSLEARAPGLVGTEILLIYCAIFDVVCVSCIRCTSLEPLLVVVFDGIEISVNK